MAAPQRLAAAPLDNRHPAAPRRAGPRTPWAIRGELILNCNCTVFCPCVISLGNHPPTEGVCQGWAGIRIDAGHYGEAPLAGLNVGLLLEIPGRMARGNWTAAAFVDERADAAAYDGLVAILSGQAGGTTGLFSVLVSTFLGAERAPVAFTTEGAARRLVVGRQIDGEVVPVRGADAGRDLVVTNSRYWMGPDITVATATRGRVRAFGRVWDFDGRSAEICAIDWKGPGR
ncbi:MAG: DUF1326 domain-containing protein [Rhodobacteraceae bacterium]|nr:DUF1326 domain-containing protein [Paracoccaceae bacterium]